MNKAKNRLAVVRYGLYSVVTFSDSWGTQRGLIWRTLIETYAGLGLKDKLLGVGRSFLPAIAAASRTRRV